MLFVLHLPPVKQSATLWVRTTARSHIFWRAAAAAGAASLPQHLPLLYSYSRQVLWLWMSRRGRSRGHWWLIFWALADCVSNGALIAFGPPPLQNKGPEKNPYKFPHARHERTRISSLRCSEQCGTGLMCDLKSISSKRKRRLPCLWRWHHLNINRASTFLRQWGGTEPRCFDRGFSTVYLEESGSRHFPFNFHMVPYVTHEV